MQRKISFVLIGVAACLHGAASTVNGAPVFGEQFELSQPNGTTVSVRVWGDEFYRVIETLDGYTVVRDPVSGIACYAELSADGNDLVSTGASISDPIPTNLVLDQGIRINSAAAQQRADTARAAFVAAAPALRGGSQPVASCNGNVTGILLLVDFADDPATIPAYEFNNFCNQVGYTGYGNNGSVRDYFYDVSGGNLVYTNYVVPAYYRASQLRSHYEDQNAAFGERASELIAEALTALDNQGFDFSQYDSNGDGRIDAVNCFIAGDYSPDWAQGLWPHCGWVNFEADGVSTHRYQITSATDQLRLGTFCHENGHMLCYWPDLYDYGQESAGVGIYSLMARGSAGGFGLNPIEPCAYCKSTAEWANIISLTASQSGISIVAGTNTVCRFNHPLRPNEYFLLENRQSTGRDASLPSEGLAIWHIDENGSNNNEQMTPELHYRVTLVQADGNWDLENNNNTGDSLDLWGHQQYSYVFNPATTPSSAWWHEDGAMFITSISVPGPIMTFNFYHNYQDCNGNGVPDIGEIASGQSTDCDESGLPDECEMGGNDCDNNGIYDPCELDGNDCNGNGTLDECDIASGDSLDEDSNSVPDECEHVIRVDWQSEAAAPQGAAWSDAYADLQDALARARTDTDIWEVWVAKGIYTPTDGDDRTESFRIDVGVSVLGGFVGDETQRTARNWAENTTTLSGSIGIATSGGDNSYHVLEIMADAVIDGFTVTHGQADGAQPGEDRGGGVYCHADTSSTFRHCIIANNYALHDGAGMFVDNAFVDINNCRLNSNEVGDRGGAIFLDGPSHPLTGGMTKSRLVSTTACHNFTGAYDGEGLGGAGLFHADGNVDIVASVFVENYVVTSWFPAFEFHENDITLGSCSLLGTDVAWNATQTQQDPNLVPPLTLAVYDSYLGVPEIVDNDPFDGLVTNYDNVLNAVSGPGVYLPTGYDPISNFRLAPDSVCIDAGKAHTGEALAKDLDGNTRTVLGRNSLDVDMGAYEYDPSAPWTRDCNTNQTPDDEDIATGVSADCNNNGYPDECESDCNGNLTPDLCDISNNTSNDVNANNIPDECEPDCNENNIPDLHEIRSGGLADVDNNEVPDICQPDCNGNSIPDSRDFAMGNSMDVNDNGVPDECENVVFVNELSQATNPDGTSWDDAFVRLQDGLAKAQADANLTEVWVARGRYQPAYDEDRTKSFVVDSNAAIYGGFVGNETQREQRDWLANTTTLTGAVGSLYADSCHVVEVMGDSLVDGFTITRGLASSSCPDGPVGAGVYCHPDTSSIFRHCVFYDNDAGEAGGALYVDDAVADIDSCYFRWNTAEKGGAIFIDGPNQPLPGGESESWIVNTTIYENKADAGSTAERRGGGICHVDGSVNIVASIIFGNTRKELQAGVGWVWSLDNITLGSCGVSGTTVAWNDAQSQQNPSLPDPFTMKLTDTYVESEGLVDDDFQDALVFDVHNVISLVDGPGLVRASSERCRLAPDSVCIDAGKAATGQALDRDLNANARIVFGRSSLDVDMGAHEYDPSVPWTQDCNYNSRPDDEDIIEGHSFDVNNNGYPDDCERDCNDNGVLDLYDIEGSTSQDINANSIPDECEPDCNFNNQPDSYDVQTGVSADVDNDEVPDECQPDCNGNSIPDSRDFAMGNSLDIDANGIPDECEHVVFVDRGSQATNPQGTSWEDAFVSLQEGLAKAQSDSNRTEVWVARGYYFADEPDQTVPFIIDSNAEVYGGFMGSETRRDQRDWREHETYLDGDDGEWPYACHVVEITGDTVLDGFFIQGGYATSACSGNGGGVYCYPGTSSTIRHCVFYDNRASGRGGAIYVGDAITRIDNCYFDWNYATRGGAIYIDGPNQPLAGGETESWITNSLIHRNYADMGLGGGFGTGGAGVYVADGSVNVIASIMFDNKREKWLAGEGRVYVQDNITLGPCGVPGSSVAWSQEQLQANPGMPVPFVMNVKDSYVVTEGLIDDDLFDALVFDLENVLSEASGPGIVRQSGHRCHLTPDSVCIDAGKAHTAQAVDRDLSGNPRTVTGRDSLDVDMGAHEYVPNGHWTQDCSNNPNECERDCNGNGVLDLYDITGSTSQDINANSIPDECEPDCNRNGTPDSYDVQEGGWADVDNNEIPDLCEPDCNNNSIPDARDFAMGNSSDCNGNGIPDSCDTMLVGVFEDDFETLASWQSYDPTHVTVATGTLDGNAVRIYTSKDERRGLSLSPSTGLNLAGAGVAVVKFDWRYTPICDGWACQFCPARVVLSYKDGSEWVDFAATSYGNFPHARAQFEVDIPLVARVDGFELMLSAELDNNAACTSGAGTSSVWIDNLEVSRAEYVDCDGNGVPDACDLSEETHSDCNENGIPDQCDIDSEASRDADFNSIPDECEHVIYVDIDAAPGGDGTSWSIAFKDLQDGLDAARADALGDQQVHAIWIAEGTYTPTQDPAERGESFTIDVDGLHVLGGFAGNETRDDQRDWVDHVTILSGDIAADEDDSYHVVILDADAVIGGVTVQGGNANGLDSQTDLGGGVLCTAYTIPAIHHCIVTGNSAKYGGGICVANAHAMISDCLVYDNTATEKGGGIYLDDQVQNTPGGLATSRVISCTISDNDAANGGGGIYHTDGNVLVENCIVFGNTLTSPADADEIRLGSCSVQQIQIPGQPATPWSPLFVMTVDHSNIGNFGVFDEDPHNGLVADLNGLYMCFDPRFVSPATGNYRLAQDSPAIDMGHAAWGHHQDLDGNPRIQMGRNANRIDMGAYEYDPNVLWTGDCNMNVVADNVDIAGGTSLDCDVNGYPDECECDCNSNGVADLCDIAHGTSQDCNNNNLPDECEPDCNNNGAADTCDIVNEISADINSNAVPDECEPDCNTNSIPDDRDFAMRISLDTNTNGIPDECEDAPPTLTNAVSQKVHGTGFTAVTRNIAEGGVECRSGGITKVKLSFDKRAKASDGTNFGASDFELSRGTITNISGMWLFQPPYSGSVTLTISGVSTPGPFSIAFIAENTAGVEENYEVCWTYVLGDIDADGDVDNADETAMLGVYQLPRGSSTFRYDLDLDNVIEANVGDDDYEILDGVNPTAQQTMCNN